MKLTVLGMNGPYPEPGKACSGYLLSNGSTRIAVDLGTGTLSRLTGLTPPEQLDAILISHWHYDHTSDLLPLVYRLQAFGKKVTLFSPRDENSLIRSIAAQSGVFEPCDITAGNSFSIGSIRVTVGPARHPVPAVSYRFESDQKTITYTGDTNWTDGLGAFVKGSDLLVADALFPEECWSMEKPHLSSVLAARLALEHQVRRLVITHMNPDYDSLQLLRAAQAVFPEVQLAGPGLTVEA